jgi:hypothetical protein
MLQPRGDLNVLGASATRTTTAPPSRRHWPPPGIRLLRLARKGEPEPAGTRLFKPLRQIIESVKTPSMSTWTWNAMAGTPRLGQDLTGHGSPDRTSPRSQAA